MIFIFFRFACFFAKKKQKHFVVAPVYSSTLLSFHAGPLVCLSKLVACQLPTSVDNTLTLDKVPHTTPLQITRTIPVN